MNKIMFFLAVAFAVCMASCVNSVKETPLSDNLIKVSQTIKNKTVNGVKTTDGKEIVPMEYADVFLAEGHIVANTDDGQHVYTLEGKKLLDDLASDISFYDDYIKFYCVDQIKFYLRKSNKVVGPYKLAGTDSGFLFCEGDSVEVFNSDGKLVAGGKKVVLLYSKADKKSYFITVGLTEEKAFAFETDGTMLFPVDMKLLEKLPKASWKVGENMCQISSRNEITAFQLVEKTKKASKKKK